MITYTQYEIDLLIKKLKLLFIEIIQYLVYK
jgi:hypothetical protein